MAIVVRRAAGRSDHAAGRAAAQKALAALPETPSDRISLSITHKHGRAIAVASASGISLGVDLERESAVDPLHARYFISPSERAAQNARALTMLWVLKEAAWKALRCAADMPFSALEIVFDHVGAVRGVIVRGIPHRARARVWAPWPDYVAAIVATRGAR